MEHQISRVKEAEPRRYNTYVLMNKPVYFWGFTSYQILACFGPIFIVAMISFALFHVLIGSLLLCLLVAPVIYIMSIIRKENSKGNPNYLASWFLAKKSPRVITDRDQVMKLLYRNPERTRYKQSR
jgi:hypothetical protein